MSKVISDNGTEKVEKATNAESMVGPEYKVTTTDKDGREHVGVGDTVEEAQEKSRRN